MHWSIQGMRRPPSPARRRWTDYVIRGLVLAGLAAILASLLVLAMVILTGCGSGGSHAASATTSKSGATSSGSITDQQGRALAFRLGTSKASVVRTLGAPAALGGPDRPGHGSTCLYYRTTGRPPTQQWRACFRGNVLASVSTYTTAS